MSAEQKNRQQRHRDKVLKKVVRIVKKECRQCKEVICIVKDLCVVWMKLRSAMHWQDR